MGNKPTIAISHLGCEKNRIDSEHMLGLLVQAGYEVDADETSADYVIVNTCSFIDAAREESIRTLVELAEADKKIVITGCMAQHFQAQLLAEIPEAVAVVGSGDYHKIVDVIERTRELSMRRVLGATRTRVMLELMLDGLLLSGLGATLGVIAAAFVFPALQSASGPFVFTRGLTFEPLLALGVLGVVVMVVTLLSSYPALLASRLKPIEALREI